MHISRPKRPPAIERESYLKFSRRKSSTQLALGIESKNPTNATNPGKSTSPPPVINPPNLSPSPSVHSLKYSSCENLGIVKEKQSSFKFTG